MDNIIILDSYEVVTDYIFNWTAFWIIAITSFIVITILYILTIGDAEVLPWTLALISTWLLVTGTIGVLVGAAAAPIPSAHTTEYKVYIDGDIDMNEFVEKYDIIDQEGSIFIVREK